MLLGHASGKASLAVCFIGDGSASIKCKSDTTRQHDFLQSGQNRSAWDVMIATASLCSIRCSCLWTWLRYCCAVFWPDVIEAVAWSGGSLHNNPAPLPWYIRSSADIIAVALACAALILANLGDRLAFPVCLFGQMQDQQVEQVHHLAKRGSSQKVAYFHCGEWARIFQGCKCVLLNALGFMLGVAKSTGKAAA